MAVFEIRVSFRRFHLFARHAPARVPCAAVQRGRWAIAAASSAVQRQGRARRHARISQAPLQAGLAFHEIWNTAGMPARIAATFDEPTLGHTDTAPPKNGTVIRETAHETKEKRTSKHKNGVYMCV